MTILAIDWGYALLVTGMGIGTVFLLLIVLIWVIGLQTKIINGITGHSKGASEEATVRTTETHPTPHEQAAIAMAMHLTIQEVEKRYSPWSSKIYSMRNTIIK